MVFSSSLFLLYFLPFFLLLYHIVPKNLKNYVILITSILFYAWGAPAFLFLMLGTIIVNFFCVKIMHKSDSTKKKKSLLTFSIIMNLGMLIYFKYANFMIENTNFILDFLEIEPISWMKVALPIGISFYTFQTLTYSIDVYRKIHAPLEKVSDYILYIMCFPQMIAGPIVRFTSIADEIIDRKETIDDKLAGFYRFCLGLGKKVLIANVMASQADLIFNTTNLSTLSSTSIWIGTLAYTLQIYFDFSGYSDMAIGLGKMIGFNFPENFNSPYTSTSITEFWRKWHMTLGSFMKDYLYIPLGGNRVKSTSRLYFNLWIVFLLSGLWHGASWNFVIWGAYHGLFLILDRIFLQKFLSRIGKFMATIITFILVMIGWIIFRIEDFNSLKIILSKLVSFENLHDFSVQVDFTLVVSIALIFAFLQSFSIGNKLEFFFFQQKEHTFKQHIVLAGISFVLFVLSISFITSSGFNPFIYFRF